MTRKPLSKKIRFEVFKRDKFTCQYCGRMSPDVILGKEYGEKAQMPEAMFSCGGTICDEKIAEYESEERKKHDFRP